MTDGASFLNVDLGRHSYPIHTGAGLLSQAGALMAPQLKQPRVIIISDETVAGRYLSTLNQSLDEAGIAHQHLLLPPGEASKSFAPFSSLMEALLALSPERSTTLVALGGGVVGDITGFAASILLRGVDFIQIPTTLLAQVDSSVGGKTGINTSQGKNLIGSFHQPRAVIIDPTTLDALPKRELLAGYAEVVKYGLLGDAEFFEWLEKNGSLLLAGDRRAQLYAIRHCCAAKASIVNRDEKEGGVRMLLNLGHTFGHALEAELGYDGRLLHGEAVSIGMVMAARLSAALGYCPESDARRIAMHLTSVGLPVLPTDIQQEWNTDRLLQHMAGDKKVSGGRITFILLRCIGEAFITQDVADAPLRDMLAQACHLP